MDRLTGGTRQRGLRVVAVFEGAKGGLVLVTGLGLLAFIHRGLHNAAEELVRHLHLNPARHYPRIFLDAAARVTDTQLWLLALSAFLYVVVRFIEAFGLWHRKRWAAWFGALSGGVYIPVELFELARGYSWVKLTVLAVNLAIVAYLGYELSASGRLPRAPFRSDLNPRSVNGVEPGGGSDGKMRDQGMGPESEKETVHPGGENPLQGTTAPERAERGGGPRSYLRGVFRSRTTLLLLVAVLVAAFAVYWFRYRPWVSTDDAEVDGHISTVSARVGGYVTRVNVEDNRKVEAGTILAEIDPSGYKIALDKAEAEYADAAASAEGARTGVPIASVTTASQLATARSAVENAQAGVAAAERDLEGAQAREQEAEANNARAQKDLQRYGILISREAVARQTYDMAVATAKVSAASLDVARAATRAAGEQVVQARGRLAQTQAELRTAGTGPQQISITRARADSADAAVKKARTAMEQARLNLQYTKVLAPVSGIVGDRTVEVGQNVSPGQTLLSVVQVGDLWVTANFKETEIRGMKPGQPARIYVDANGHTYKGRVDSIGAASGARFSLFPPENATGNYVKVVQRVPVKIVFENGQDVERMLRPGMSVEPEVKVR